MVNLFIQVQEIFLLTECGLIAKVNLGDDLLRIAPSENSAIIILLTGIILMLLTFILACVHLYGDINVLPVPSFLTSFGEALSPLIEAAIRVLYLGVMGWIASIVTAKGLALLLHTRRQEKDNLHSQQ